MAFKKCKELVSAVLASALAITACVTTVNGENSPLAKKNNGKVYQSVSQTIIGQLGSIYDVQPQKASDSVFGLTGSFSGTSYYEQLDKDSQKVYNGIYEKYKGGMKNGEAVEIIEYFPEMKFTVTGTVSGGYFNLDDASKELVWGTIGGYLYPAFLALTADHPELSWISYCSYNTRLAVSGIKSNSDGTYTYPVTSLTLTLSTKNIYGTPDEISSAVSKAKGVIGVQETKYEQVKAIHDYLCNTIDYNYTAIKNEAELPAGYDVGYYQTAYSAFYRIPQDENTDLGKKTDKNLTVCAGYARSFKVLCEQDDIPCIYVVGHGINNSGSKQSHDWNYVKMDDGNWYAVDATWDDQSSRIYYEYFLAGSDTPGFNSLTFGQSHQESGVWSSDTTYVFKYPTLAREAFDPNKAPAETTPVTETTTPVSEVTTPVTETTTPVSEVTTPVTETTTPVSEVTTPVSEVTTPVSEATTSVSEVTTPVSEATTPVSEVTTPVSEATTSVSEATTSVSEATTSVSEATTSVSEVTTPASEATTSVSEVTTPASEETTPASEETTPAPEETTPVTEVTTAPETTYSPEQLGNLDAVVNTEEGAPAAEIDMDKNQIADAVLSEEEKELLKNGEISVSLNIDNIDNTVSDDVKKAVEEFLTSAQDGLSVGLYIDISIYKTAGGSEKAVTNTNMPIRIKLSIPENLRKDGRSFAAVRVHNGKTELLSDLDGDSDTITIESDLFSDYAIVYADSAVITDSTTAPDKTDNDDNKNTGLGFETSMVIFMIISAATVFCSAVAIYVKGAKSKR